MDLQGKVAIITGASSGIGRAIAQSFASAGARVVLSGRRTDTLLKLKDEVEARGGAAVVCAGDVCEADYARALVTTALDAWGQLDIAVNNAGILGELGPLETLSLDAWNQTLTTNLTAAFLGAKHQIPEMKARGSGSLIFTSSFVGQGIGFAGMGAYAASKAGLVGLTQALAVELGPDSIRVNALLPGGTKTPMAGDFSANPDTEATIAGFHALKRMAEPEEIAKAALFLASDASSFITGSSLVADGGNSITKS